MRWSYKKAVEFIALNDDPEVLYRDLIKSTMSVITLSVACGKTTEEIAKDVYNLRIKETCRKAKKEINLEHK